MLKVRVSTIEEYIEQRKNENIGKYSKLVGADGFEMNLTTENYNKLKGICKKRYESNFKKMKKIS